MVRFSGREVQMMGRWARSRREVPQDLRTIVIETIRRNPLGEVSDPLVLEHMDAGEDVSFDQLGLDSLSRLTIAIDLGELGFDLSEVDVEKARTVDGLARLLRDLS